MVLHTNNIQIGTYGTTSGIVYTPTSYTDSKFLAVPPTSGIRFSCKSDAANASWTQNAVITNTDPAKVAGVWNYISTDKWIGCGSVLDATSRSSWVYNGVIQGALTFNDGMRNVGSDNDFWFVLDGIFFGGYVDTNYRECNNPATSTYSVQNATSGSWAFWTR